MPGEYAAINDLDGPDDFVPADVVATAAVAGAIFGVGRRRGARSRRSRCRRRASASAAARGDARLARLPLGRRPRGRRRRCTASASPTRCHPSAPRGVALPDRGTREVPPRSLEKAEAPGSTTGAQRCSRSRARSRTRCSSPRASRSRATRSRSSARRPPTSRRRCWWSRTSTRPGYDARGVAFPGVNLFVQLGHGRDYAWSATTSAQDIVDTFAVELCDDTHYRFRGALPRDRGARADATSGARTPPTRRRPGSETLRDRAHGARAS